MKNTQMTSHSIQPWIDAVNEFWFQELKPEDWFSGRQEVDSLIRSRFASLLGELRSNPPPAETLTAAGHVAAVIVFDQFSRNLFRDSAEAYATDDIALSLSKHAINTKVDAKLDAHQRHFLYMPFMHSEARTEQARSIKLFASLDTPDVLNYAKHHNEIVDRFGRFPHRNIVLGRKSTPEEEEFLRTEARPY